MEYREKHIRREAFVAMLSVCGCGENELLKASELLDDESATVLADALYALSLCEQLPLWLGERAEALLSHEAPEVRTGALSILGKRPGENVDERVEQILGSLNDNDPQVRAEAVEALKYVRPVSRRVVESLGVACCRDVDAAVRAFSVKALGKMGREARAAQEYVLEALHDPDSVVRQHAARTLALIDADAEKAVVALEALVERENEGSPEYMMGVRMAARESLEKIRGESQ
jgi:HEAT repeat protein